MIRRLLQWLVVAIGAVLLAAAWHVAQGGSAVWTAVIVVLALGGHGILLLAEMLLMRAVNRRRGQPVPTWRATLRAWASECVVAPWVFCWQQPFRHRRWPDTCDADGSPGRRGVLLVHGWACNRAVWNGWLARLAQRRVPVIAIDLDPPWAPIDQHRRVIDDAVARLHARTGLAPVVVAHSMGGLAVRRWLMTPGRAARIDHLITLGSPHHGTWLARLGVGASVRQMREHSRWLRVVDAAEDTALRRRFTCYMAGCDNVVFPVRSAWLEGADNRWLHGVAHLDMLCHPEPFEQLLGRLEPGPELRAAARPGR